MTTQPGNRQPILLPPIKQESDSHCGPATLQLLYSFLKQPFTQKQIVKAAGIKKTIAQQGSRPYQLAKAVSNLTPEYEFWFKPNATSEDLEKLICEARWPVGVNWQGLYYDRPEEEKIAELERLPGQNGHYSVVIDIDRASDEIVIADPYYEFSERPRKLSLSWFESRWWDRVQDTDPKTGEITFTTTDKLLFLIAPRDKKPLGIELKPASELSILTF